MIRGALALVVASVFCSAPLCAGPSAQAQVQSAAPLRDKPAVKNGKSVIKGRIVLAETGQPLRRAKVSLETANPLEARGTTTDLDGRYEFTDLPAGEYRVTASKGLHVTLAYGQRRPNERGQSVELKEEQVAEGIDIALPHGGIIAGVLLDDVGEPAAGVRVTAMKQQYRDGRRGLVGIGRSVETNDRGEYRLYGLPPGSYFVGALPSNASSFMPLLSTSNGATTYYPGTLSENEAQRVIVRAGEERRVEDFTLVPARLVKVAGTATSPTGAPAQMVMLTPTMQLGSANAPPGITPATVRPDGGFQFTNVAPGEYMLMAMALNAATGEQQVTSTKLTVAGEDVTDVALYMTSGFRAAGQIVFDQAIPLTGLTPSGLMLVATPASTYEMTGAIGRVAIREDWTFEAKGLAGARVFRVAQGLPSGWMIHSVFHARTDITDKPLDVNEDVDGILITLTNRPARISGSVVDDRGRPSADCTVVLFPEDAALGPPASTRYLRTVRPDDAGRFKAENLAASSYLAVAVESLEQGDENDPELLEQLRAQATRVALDWGEAKELALRVVKLQAR